MAPLSLVGLLALAALSNANVKEVIYNCVHPPQTPDQQKDINYLASNVNNFVTSSAAYTSNQPTNPNDYWWMNPNSPLKQAYDHFKKCSEKGNCLPPATAPGVAPAPSTAGVAPNPNLINQPQYQSGGGSIDIAKNPFLNGEYQGLALTSCTGTACKNGKPQTILTTCKGTQCQNTEIKPTDLSGNPFLNGGVQTLQPQTPSDSFIKTNPFLNGQATVTTGSGASIPKGDGFLGVQPSQPFGNEPKKGSTGVGSQEKLPFSTTHPLSNKKPFSTVHPNEGIACSGAGFICVDNDLCTNGVVNNNGQGLFQVRSDVQYCARGKETCCRLPDVPKHTSTTHKVLQLPNLITGNGQSSQSLAQGINDLSSTITAGKSSVPGSTIKFGGGAGLSPGLIQVLPDQSNDIKPHVFVSSESGSQYSSSTVKPIRATSSPNSVFSSTIDYSDSKFDDNVRFQSTIRGPAYLPPVPSTPIGHVTDRPAISTYQPSIPTSTYKPFRPEPTIPVFVSSTTTTTRPYDIPVVVGPQPSKPPTYTGNQHFVVTRPQPSSPGYLPPRPSTPDQYVPSYPTTQRPYQPSGATNSPYQPSRPSFPSQPTPQQPYRPQTPPQKPYQPQPTPERPYQPQPSTQKPYQPQPTPERPSFPSYQPQPTPERPYQPQPSTQKPYQPYQPQPTPERPYQPQPSTQKPYQPYQPQPTPDRPYQPQPSTQKPYEPYQPQPTPERPGFPSYQPQPTPERPYHPQPSTQKPYQPYQPSTQKPYQPYQPQPTPERPSFPSYQPSSPSYQPSTDRGYLPPKPSTPFVPQPSSPRPNPFIPDYTPPKTYPSSPRPPIPSYPTSPSGPVTTGYEYPGPSSPKPHNPFIPQLPEITEKPYQPSFTQPPYRPSTPQQPYQPPQTYKPSIPHQHYQPSSTPKPYQPTTNGYHYPNPSTDKPFVPSRPGQPSYHQPSTVFPPKPSGGYDYSPPTPTLSYPTHRPSETSINNKYVPPQPYKPPTTPNQYLPPPKPNDGSSVDSTPERPDNQGESGNINTNIIRPTTSPPPPQLHTAPSTPQFNTAPPASCAAALKCVQEIYCTAEGVVSPVPVVLTKEQEINRVPTTVCHDQEAGIIGKCCRDPNYKDPWPSANLVNGVDDGQYKEDANLGQYSQEKQRIVRSGPRQSSQNPFLNSAQPNPEPQLTCGQRHQNSNPPGQGPLDVNFSEIPWQAMILRDTNRSLLCGGAIIRRDAVLTAAHCVEGLDTKDVLIKGGEWKLGIDEEPLPFQIVKVSVIIRHPEYRPGSFLNDLAVLVLEEKLRLAKNVATICLPQPNQIPTQNCIATGWGKRILQLHAKGALMHAINVNIMDTQQCQQSLSNSFQQSLTNYSPNTLCGYSDIDQCKVDYGSALACQIAPNQYSLSGIYSWDTGCKQEGQIGGYVAPDVEWIHSCLGRPLNELKRLEREYITQYGN